MDDDMRGLAVLHALQIIGEACRRIPPHIRARHSAIPWRQIIGFRNIVVHAYPDVEMKEVWDIIHRDLEPLRAEVQAILTEIEASSGDA